MFGISCSSNRVTIKLLWDKSVLRRYIWIRNWNIFGGLAKLSLSIREKLIRIVFWESSYTILFAVSTLFAQGEFLKRLCRRATPKKVLIRFIFVSGWCDSWFIQFRALLVIFVVSIMKPVNYTYCIYSTCFTDFN